MDPFESLLSLEDQFYDEGYQLGVADGYRAGRIEGRVFGLEKGFERYVAMGALHGKSAVWSGRLTKAPKQREADPAPLPAQHQQHKEQLSSVHVGGSRTVGDSGVGGESMAAEGASEQDVQALPDNPRLQRHIQTLHALTEPASLSTQNNEDAVSDFDDRLRRAGAKVKVIEKLIDEADKNSGEGSPNADGMMGGKASGSCASKQSKEDDGQGNIEDISALQARH
ncbi:MAG: hypothetical protein M1827_002846 [Pycnora praestabilis]|nr:MAG: hypothetical protein M1827_002846 [Pycnora praestabilis]